MVEKSVIGVENSDKTLDVSAISTEFFINCLVFCNTDEFHPHYYPKSVRQDIPFTIQIVMRDKHSLLLPTSWYAPFRHRFVTDNSAKRLEFLLPTSIFWEKVNLSATRHKNLFKDRIFGQVDCYFCYNRRIPCWSARKSRCLRWSYFGKTCRKLGKSSVLPILLFFSILCAKETNNSTPRGKGIQFHTLTP